MRLSVAALKVLAVWMLFGVVALLGFAAMLGLVVA